tara:strand:+ start:1671 stop:2330 length:660 start_codon:yes stop_codon:yes gene_type:complete
MPVVDLYGTTNGDGWLSKSSTTSWSDARDNTTASSGSSSSTYSGFAIRATAASGRGGTTTYVCTRAFIYIDTSSVATVPSSGLLRIFGASYGNASVVPVKATHGSSITTADFDAIDGWDNLGGNHSADVTYYGNILNSWSTSGYNDFTLTSDALNDIANNDNIQICLMQYTNDVRGSTPSSSSNYSGMFFADYVSSSRRPYLNLQIPEANNSIFFGTNF